MTFESEERKALRELVALKDLKDKIENRAHHGIEVRPGGPGYREQCDELDEFRIEYARRKPDAWAAARAVLARPEARPRSAAPKEAIGRLLTAAMEQATANGANSVSMPDELVEIAAWLAKESSPSKQMSTDEQNIVSLRAALAAGPKRWPFVESPADFANRFLAAVHEFGTYLAAVRHILIEKPPRYVIDPDTVRQLLTERDTLKATLQETIHQATQYDGLESKTGPAMWFALDEETAALLRDTIGEAASPITLTVGSIGLYVYLTDYPEEGFIPLVTLDKKPEFPEPDLLVECAQKVRDGIQAHRKPKP